MGKKKDFTDLPIGELVNIKYEIEDRIGSCLVKIAKEFGLEYSNFSVEASWRYSHESEEHLPWAVVRFDALEELWNEKLDEYISKYKQ